MGLAYVSINTGPEELEVPTQLRFASDHGRCATRQTSDARHPRGRPSRPNIVLVP